MNNELRGELNIVAQLVGGNLTLPLVIDGVGIQSIVYNPDFSFTIVLTDGSSYTSPPMKGDQGDPFTYDDFTPEELAGLVGPGVAPGGTTNQVLAKRSDNDYDTEWVDQTGGTQYELPPATTETLGGIIVGGDLLVTDNGVLSVDKTNVVASDNTKPITAAAVYTEIGNINALLATI